MQLSPPLLPKAPLPPSLKDRPTEVLAVDLLAIPLVHMVVPMVILGVGLKAEQVGGATVVILATVTNQKTHGIAFFLLRKNLYQDYTTVL